MRYFFHVVDGGTCSADDEGSEFETDDDARKEANLYMTEIAASIILTDAGRRIGIQVVNEAGVTVAAIGVVMEKGPDLGSLACYQHRSGA